MRGRARNMYNDMRLWLVYGSHDRGIRTPHGKALWVGADRLEIHCEELRRAGTPIKAIYDDKYDVENYRHYPHKLIVEF